MSKNNTTFLLMFSISAGFWSVTGCRSPEKEPDCVNPPPTKVAPAAKAKIVANPIMKRTLVEGNTTEAEDWCRACVVGPHGFMSCQRVVASQGEPREEVKKRARLAACLDSGFTEATCPEGSVIAISCKEDKPSDDKMAAGQKVLKALKSSGPLVLKGDVKAVKKIHVGADPGTDSKKQETSPAKADLK